MYLKLTSDRKGRLKPRSICLRMIFIIAAHNSIFLFHLDQSLKNVLC